MARLIQYMTRDSMYDGPFGGQAGWPAAGMGYVIAGDGGGLIVIDGGQPNDALCFAKLLEAQTDGALPIVDKWIITHPHIDHYGAIQAISRDPELKRRIRVKEFIYWFPEEFCDKNGVGNLLKGANDDMDEVCHNMCAGCRRPQRDEIYKLDDVSLQFLYVPDDCSIFNSSGGNANMCSLIFTVSGKEKKAMITGDAYRRSMQITAWRYHKELKCDVLQMPHHYLCDAFCVDFYRYVSPEILLLPISRAGYRAMHSKEYDKLEGCIANLCAEAKAEGVYKAFEGTSEIII